MKMCILHKTLAINFIVFSRIWSNYPGFTGFHQITSDLVGFTVIQHSGFLYCQINFGPIGNSVRGWYHPQALPPINYNPIWSQIGGEMSQTSAQIWKELYLGVKDAIFSII